MASLAERLRTQLRQAGRGGIAAALRHAFARAFAPPAAAPAPPPHAAGARTAGHFETGTFANHAGARDYRLHIPAGAQASALLVMLHGCGQDADDFARGTRMHAAAGQYGCMVLYPQQSGEHNRARCWNWFSPRDQRAGAGEPAILAGMTTKIAARYRIDPARVFVAGLSAGGAMAAILATEYPQLFRACAVHSGLPPGAARDLASALTAMKHGAAPPGGGRSTVPLIVFHGERDATVSPRNSHALIRLALSQAHATAETEQGRQDDAGHRYTRQIYRAADGRTLAEHWLIHGAAHAWSGGHADGSHTDPKGPDASLEILRFFHQHGTRNL